MTLPIGDALLKLKDQLELHGRVARAEPSKDDLEKARRAVDGEKQ